MPEDGASLPAQGRIGLPHADGKAIHCASVEIEVPDTIVGVDCGGECHRLGYEPPEGWEPGAVVAYRCVECLDRWDLVFDGEEQR